MQIVIYGLRLYNIISYNCKELGISYVKISDVKCMNPRQKHLLRTHRRNANTEGGPQNLPS